MAGNLAFAVESGGAAVTLWSIVAYADWWTPVRRLAALPLADLVARGLVAIWDHPNPAVGAVATLTPLGAEHIGVELIETADCRPRWDDRRAEEDRPPIRLPHEWRTVHMDLPTWLRYPAEKPVSRQVVYALDEDGKPRTMFNGWPVMVDRRVG